MSISLYADDAVIFCSNFDPYFIKTRLERSLTAIFNWCQKNYININVHKTKFCIYGTRSLVKQYTDVQLGSGDHQIVKCQQYNYLGVKLDECLNLKANFKGIFKKFSHKIYKLGKIKRYIDTCNRVLVYKQTILPLVEYVSFMLLFNSSQEVDKLQKLQNRSLRMCYDIHNPRDVSELQLHEMASVS